MPSPRALGLHLLAGDLQVLEQALVGLGGEDPEQRVADREVAENDAFRAVDADSGVLAAVEIAAAAHVEAVHLDAGRLDAQHGPFAAAVQGCTRDTEEPQPLLHGDALAVDALDAQGIALPRPLHCRSDGILRPDVEDFRVQRRGDEQHGCDRGGDRLLALAGERQRGGEHEPDHEQCGNPCQVQPDPRLRGHLELRDDVFAEQAGVDVAEDQVERGVRIAIVRGPRHGDVQIDEEEDRQEYGRQCSRGAMPALAQERHHENAGDRDGEPDGRQQALQRGERLHLADPDVVPEVVHLEHVAGDRTRVHLHDQRPLPVLRRARLHRHHGEVQAKPRQSRATTRRVALAAVSGVRSIWRLLHRRDLRAPRLDQHPARHLHVQGGAELGAVVGIDAGPGPRPRSACSVAPGSMERFTFQPCRPNPWVASRALSTLVQAKITLSPSFTRTMSGV